MRAALILVVLFLASGGSVAWAAEAPQPLSDAQAEAIVAKAPKLPVDLKLDLKTRLVDFIDCTDAKDPHGFKDQGTSSVVTGPAGTYRITAAHRHAFFAYRFRAAGKDKPVLIIWEYPDDADRTMVFSTHESGLSGRANSDWSLETGVYTGEPFPVTGKMQYHTFIMWPQDAWPCALVGNFHRYGHPAAASRIWVYVIEGRLPKLQVDEPDAANPRRLGHYNSRGYYLAQRLYFGLRSPKAVEHMLDYFDYVGVNEVSWGVAHSDDATIPSWGLRGTHLEEVLSAMDARGHLSFTAQFYLSASSSIGGRKIADMTQDELRAAMVKGFDEFLERYGKFKSLKGIALGGMYGIEFLDTLREKGVATDVVAHIKAKRPDLQVITYVGGEHLHQEYFNGTTAATGSDVISGWETSGASWSDWLGDQALKAWKGWGRDPADLKAIKGLMVYEQYQPDDNRIFSNYDQQPRSLIYHDLDCSQRRSDHLATPYANLWNTHYEGWYGLNPQVNFWYQKHWVAPDMNPPPPLSQAPLTRTLGHRDRLVIIPGSWNNRYFGWESSGRRFAKAFRSLPPVAMADVDVAGTDTVKARWVAWKGRRYVALVSRIPFESEVTVDGKAVTLPPYELVTQVDDGSAEPRVIGKPPREYVAWVTARVKKLAQLHKAVGSLNQEAAPAVYLDAAAQATKLLDARRAYAAEMEMGAGLIGEMQLRKDILDPPKLGASWVTQAPPMNGRLDDWPKDSTDIRAEGGEYLAGHTYFPNSWSGPDDLSARLRFCHDATKLYVGIEVRDSVLAQYEEDWNRRKTLCKRADSCTMRLSTDGAYLDWIAPVGKKSDVTWPISLPFDGKDTSGKGRAGFEYTCRRTLKGYVFEGSAPLADLKVQVGGSIGFLLFLGDVDKTQNIKGSGWAAKQAFLCPHKPNYRYWDDVRNCGRLVIER